MVTKVARRDGANIQLKAAASYIESDAIRDVVSKLRAGSGNKSELIDKVILLTCGYRDITDNSRKPTSLSNAPMKCR